jgi:DNA-binding MarR family transcriptional regulator
VIALRRDPDPADRRAKIITLTDLGLERYKPTRRDIRAMERRRLRGVGAAEIASLRHLLALLASD